MSWALLWLPMGALLVRLLGWKLKLPIPPEQKIPLLLSLYWLAPLLLWGYVRYGEKGSLANYGVVWHHPFYSRVALGFVLGVISIISLLLIKQCLTWVQWQGLSLEKDPSPPGTGQWIRALLSIGLPIGLLSLVISWVEEMVFRGFVVNQLRLAYGWGPTIAIACTIFALLHLIWDGPEGIPQLPGLWLMGAVLMLARWADGGWLGLPTGLHAGWIFSLALVDSLHLVTPDPSAPRWWAGRPHQPLTGILDGLLLLATAGIVGLM